jgi:hypothetical protein
VAAGYVTLDRAMQVEVTSNLRGHYLHLAVGGGVVKAVEVRGLGTQARVGEAPTAVWIPRQPRGDTVRVMDLGFRMELAPGASPGVHAWPLRMMMPNV